MISLLKELKNKNYSLWLEGDNIRILCGEDELSDFFINEIKHNKDKIVRFFRDKKIFTNNDFEQLDHELEFCPLSFPQEQLLFIEEFENEFVPYHIPLAFKLSKEVDIDILYSSLFIIFQKHDVFRTVFKTDDTGKRYQYILPDYKEINMKIIVLDNEEKLRESFAEKINIKFNLDKDPPVKLFRYIIDDDQFFLIILHHISFDAWSIDVFLKELLYI